MVVSHWKAVKYTVEIVMIPATGQETPSADETERIIDKAIKDSLNTPLTPYYVASTSVTKRERV